MLVVAPGAKLHFVSLARDANRYHIDLLLKYFVCYPSFLHKIIISNTTNLFPFVIRVMFDGIYPAFVVWKDERDGECLILGNPPSLSRLSSAIRSGRTARTCAKVALIASVAPHVPRYAADTSYRHAKANDRLFRVGPPKSPRKRARTAAITRITG